MTYLAYCIDKKFYKAIDYLREQVRVLVDPLCTNGFHNILKSSGVKSVKNEDAEIVCIERLGGLLKSYHRL